MKRLMLITMLCLATLGAQAQQTDTYHPFLSKGKSWMMLQYDVMDRWCREARYYFSNNENNTYIDGHEYEQMCSITDDGVERSLGLFREEGRTVYYRSSAEENESLVYDFSLEVGDEVELALTPADEPWRVTAVGDTLINGIRLKTISFNNSTRPQWIEGIGTTTSPMDFMPVPTCGYQERVAYVCNFDSNAAYFPLTISEPLALWGQNLARGEEIAYDEDSLDYELVPDPEHTGYMRLHVTGSMAMHCDPYNYIYCTVEQERNDTFYISFKQNALYETDCIGSFRVDLYFPSFPEGTYIVVDRQGEHTVTAIESRPYRPFIEEGKVWKVGWCPGLLNTAQRLEYYYFDGDTIVDHRSCKKMMCLHECSDEWPFAGGSTEPWTEYAGAIYEEGRRVYCAFPGSEMLELMYDFATPAGNAVSVHGGSCIIAGKDSWASEFFKGANTGVALYQQLSPDSTSAYGYDFDNLNVWAEGIGCAGNPPLDNVWQWGLAGNYYFLLSCTVGDEVLYCNPHILDGVTPAGDEVKKQWLDFTHTIKTRPKAPAVAGTEDTEPEALSGEYSAKELSVNFAPLAGRYTVSIASAAGQEVYRRVVETSSVLALSTDLSTYAAGTYTLRVENAIDAYTASFTLDDTSSVDNGQLIMDNGQLIMDNGQLRSGIVDLSGRRVNNGPLRSGIYIVNGRKVVLP